MRAQPGVLPGVWQVVCIAALRGIVSENGALMISHMCHMSHVGPYIISYGAGPHMSHISHMGPWGSCTVLFKHANASCESLLPTRFNMPPMAPRFSGDKTPSKCFVLVLHYITGTQSATGLPPSTSRLSP